MNMNEKNVCCNSNVAAGRRMRMPTLELEPRQPADFEQELHFVDNSYDE